MINFDDLWEIFVVTIMPKIDEFNVKELQIATFVNYDEARTYFLEMLDSEIDVEVSTGSLENRIGVTCRDFVIVLDKYKRSALFT